MKLALLGIDRDVLQLAQAAVRDGHVLVAVYEAVEYQSEIHALAPLAARDDSWESLLHGTVADGVVVARGGQADDLADKLRKLVQAAVPLLVVHPIDESIVCYELDMIRGDTGCIILPYIPQTSHPAVGRLAAWAGTHSDSPIGQIEQLVFDRTLGDRPTTPVPLEFARDIDLVRKIMGEVRKVAAMSTSDAATAEGNLGVHLSTDLGALARWSIQPGEEGPRGRMVLYGSTGRATLTMPEEGVNWTLQVSGSAGYEHGFDPWDAAGAAIDALDQAMRGADVRPDWNDACRDAELAELVAESLRRGRTIELHDGPRSEESTFMGIMAAGGCAMLMLTMLVLLIAALVEGLQLPFRTHILWRLWPFYLLLPLTAFLVLQLLRLIFPRDADG